MASTTASRKSKGRTAQQEVRRSLLDRIYLPHGCEEDDCKSTPMGSSGVDIQLSPAARKVFDMVNETKNVESLNVVKTFIDHHAKYHKHPGTKLLTHRRNRTPMLVTLLWSDFLDILEDHIRARRS